MNFASSKITVLELETKLIAAIIEMGVNCDVDFAIEVASRLQNTSLHLKHSLNAQKECFLNDRYGSEDCDYQD
jgi:hypothetical protein